jgi:hypothetical protein
MEGNTKKKKQELQRLTMAVDDAEVEHSQLERQLMELEERVERAKREEEARYNAKLKAIKKDEKSKKKRKKE